MKKFKKIVKIILFCLSIGFFISLLAFGAFVVWFLAVNGQKIDSFIKSKVTIETPKHC